MSQTKSQFDVSKPKEPTSSSPSKTLRPFSREERIDLFVQQVEQGVVAWRRAGENLKALQDENKNTFREIMDKCPYMTLDVLWTFYRIGEGKLEPKVLLLPRNAGSAKLLELPADKQRELVDHPIKVVCAIRDGKVIQTERLVKEMDKKQLLVAFNGTKLRSTSEQVETFKALNGEYTESSESKHRINFVHRDPIPASPEYHIVRYGLFDLVMGEGKVTFSPHTGKSDSKIVQVPITKCQDGAYRAVVEIIEMRKK